MTFQLFQKHSFLANHISNCEFVIHSFDIKIKYRHSRKFMVARIIFICFEVIFYLITKLNDGHEDLARRMHVGTGSSLLLQTQENVQSFGQLVLLGQLLSDRKLLVDDGRTVDLHLDDLTAAFDDDLVELGVARQHLLRLLFGHFHEGEVGFDH